MIDTDLTNIRLLTGDLLHRINTETPLVDKQYSMTEVPVLELAKK